MDRGNDGHSERQIQTQRQIDVERYRQNEVCEISRDRDK